MGNWVYTGINRGSEFRRGEIVADSLDEAKAAVEGLGMAVISVTSIENPDIEFMADLTPKHVPEEKPLQKTELPAPTFPEPLPAQKRTQRIVGGEMGATILEVNKILAKGGTVAHAVMHPDAVGRMTLVVVLEEDERK